MAGPRIHEDPAIAVVARLEAAAIWDDLERRMRDDGQDFYMAREVALALRMPSCRKLYGHDVARRAETAVLCRHPSTVSRATKRAIDEQSRRELFQYLDSIGWKPRWIDRICMRITGRPWSV